MFHGHAHGGEMPELAQPFAFATGFMAGTTVIHLVGVCIGLLFAQLRRGDAFLKITGLGMAGSGLWFLFS
jgi:urease accessory protein